MNPISVTEAPPEAEGRDSAFRAEMTARHVHHVREGTTDIHGDGPRFVAATEYTDPTVHDDERRMFRETPLVAAVSAQLAVPGAYCTQDIQGVPVLVVRQDDGSLKAFLPSFAPLAHVIRVSPGPNPREHVTELLGLHRAGADETELATVDEFLGMVRFAIDEGYYPNGHAIQRALNSGLKDGLRFGANELTLTTIHRSIAAAIGRPGPDEGVRTQ